ncbi:hypothetical protein GCM10027605_47150 [Micromonospora zhanjiangensis]
MQKLFAKLGRHGRILAVVDQPASIGALPVAVARACGHQIAYLPGLVMRQLADLQSGTAKTDARDAYVIADAAHTLRRVDTGDDTLAELEMMVGYNDDLAGEVTASATASAACSPRSIHRWNPSWARKCSTQPCWRHCRGAVGRPGCARPAGRNSPRSSDPELHAWVTVWSSRSLPPWTPRRW